MSLHWSVMEKQTGNVIRNQGAGKAKDKVEVSNCSLSEYFIAIVYMRQNCLARAVNLDLFAELFHKDYSLLIRINSV